MRGRVQLIACSASHYRHLANTNETRPITNRRSAYQCRTLAKVAELTVVKLSTYALHILRSKTPESQIRISPNSYAMYNIPINLLKSKLRYWNPFRNASMPDEGRSSNCGQVPIAGCAMGPSLLSVASRRFGATAGKKFGL